MQSDREQHRPMAAALADLPLAAEIRDALVGKPNVARSILNAVIAYERGDFDAAAAMAEGLGLRAETLAAAYGDALRYARELSRMCSQRSSSRKSLWIGRACPPPPGSGEVSPQRA